jgi:hypothetical protein
LGIFCTTPWIIPFKNIVHCSFRYFLTYLRLVHMNGLL